MKAMDTERPGPVRPLQSPRELGYRWPAEWEPQRAVWFAWPHNREDWPGKFDCIEWVFCEMLGQVARRQTVGLVVAAEQQAHALRTLARCGVPPERVECWLAPTQRSWTRDTFPTWLQGPGGELGAVKWRFNGWARYPNHAQDEAAAAAVALARAQALWLPEAQEGVRFVLEGGAIDGDGEGTLLTTEACLLGQEFPRNPGLSQAEIERTLADYLGASRVIWIPGGIAGDDTQGHVDDLARFVAPGKVVVAAERESSDDNYRPLAAARESLMGQRDAAGRTLEVIELPMPRPRAFDGQRLPASYANFLILNGLVLVPTFNDPADTRAIGILRELFPDREVVGIYCGDLVLGLGAIHCSSHQEPDVRPGR